MFGVSRLVDTSAMGEKPLKIDAVERQIATHLREELEARGWTPAQLARESGVNRSRVYTMLANESPMGVSSLFDMCDALGLRASDVVRDAESVVAAREREAMSQDDDTVATSSHGDTVPERPADDLEAERDRIAALIAAGVDPYELGLAASRGRGTARALEETTGWRDDLGEESQVGPEEE